jgi:hypothetical protein
MGLKHNLVSAANEQVISSCLPAFYALVPDEETALDLILQVQIQQRRLRCKCGYVFESATRAMYERRVKCKVCRRKIYFTVGTLYEGVANVRARLGAVWLMEHGAVVTSTKLNQLFGIATSTGLSIINSIGAFIEAMRGSRFEEASERVNCPIFGEIMIKRSRISGAYEHASSVPAEVADSDVDAGTNADSGHFNQSASSSDDLGDLDRAVLALISAAPISVDSICQKVDQPAGAVGAALTMLEILGHISSIPGNSFVRPTSPKRESCSVESPKLLEFIEAAVQNIKAIRQGVSRKYLQLYLGAFWCFFDNEFWQEGSLLLVSLDSSLSPDRNLFDYESPLMVSVVSSSC